MTPLFPDPTGEGSPDDTSLPAVSRRHAAAGGAVAAAVALGVGELVGGLVGVIGGTPVRLVGSVGDWFIDSAGQRLAAPAISALGSAAKPTLVVAILVVCLGLGALVGMVTTRRRQVAPMAFATAAVAGGAAAVTAGDAPVVGTVITATSAALAGWASLGVLLAVAGGRPPMGIVTTRSLTTARTPGDRRQFLGWAGATAVVAGVAAIAGRALGGSAAESARAGVRLPGAATTPGASRVGAVGTELATPGVTPVITPTRDFYRIDTALVLPDVDPGNWSLRIDGLVDTPLTLTYEDLLTRSMVEQVITIACVSNPVGGDLVGTAVWQGVPLADLLAEAGVQPGAEQLVGRSVDGFTVGFPTTAATDGRAALVAVGMNGEPLPVRHGFPARLVVSGLYGYVSATKWLSQIELTTWDGFDAYWIPRGWAKEAPVRTQSRIDVPTSRSALRPGPVPVAGVAWAPNVGIAAVEVQVDDEPWQQAELSEPLSDDTWRQWLYLWEATPGLHRLRVRATDRTGATQPEGPRSVLPDGAEGWHTRRLTVEG